MTSEVSSLVFCCSLSPSTECLMPWHSFLVVQETPFHCLTWSWVLYSFCSQSCFPFHSSAQSLYHVPLFATSWAVVHKALLSMGFFRQEYWSGFPFPPPEDIPDLGIKPMSPASPALTGRFFTTELPGSPIHLCTDTQ